MILYVIKLYSRINVFSEKEILSTALMHLLIKQKCLLLLLKVYFQENLNSRKKNHNIMTYTNIKWFPIALTQVKAGNTSEDLVNEIRQIISFLYRAKETTKKVCSNINNSI